MEKTGSMTGDRTDITRRRLTSAMLSTAALAALPLAAGIQSGTRAATAGTKGGDTMIIQFVRFQSALTYDEVLAVARERLPDFQALPGLVQKYYVRLNAPDSYGGIYVWESGEALADYRKSALFASIPKAYGIKGQPQVEVLEGLFQLRG
jgi:heme-degrading monooxygenase HmoA